MKKLKKIIFFVWKFLKVLSNSILKILGITTKEIEEISPVEEDTV